MATNYTIQKGDTLSQIAKNYGTTTQDLLRLNPTITNPDLISYGQSLNLPTTSSTTPVVNQPQQPVSPTINQPQLPPISPVIDTTSGFGPGSALSNPLYVPPSNSNEAVITYLNSGNTAYNQYQQQQVQQQQQITSLQQAQQQAQQALDKALAERQAEVDRAKAQTQAEQDRILGDINTWTQPFREQYENAQREYLQVNKNFQDNQALVNELGSLLQEGNDLIAMQKGVTGIASIRNPRISQAIDSVNARAGVIQAVMSARNNQISVATNLIDRGVQAITADRQDRLGYYQTLLELNDKKLVSLTDESKQIAYAQISQLETNLEDARASANYIKELMISPDTAAFIGNSGVTLNDTVEEINKKMTAYGNKLRIDEIILEFASKGYKNTPIQLANSLAVPVGDKILYFTPPPEKTKATGSVSSNGLPGKKLSSNELDQIRRISGISLPTGFTDTVAEDFIAFVGKNPTIAEAEDETIFAYAQSYLEKRKSGLSHTEAVSALNLENEKVWLDENKPGFFTSKKKKEEYNRRKEAYEKQVGTTATTSTVENPVMNLKRLVLDTDYNTPTYTTSSTAASTVVRK